MIYIEKPKKKINTIKEKEIKFNKKNEKKIAFSPVKQNLGVRSKM